MNKTATFIFASIALAVAACSQTAQVLVGTNGVVSSPTNFWTVNATNVILSNITGTLAVNKGGTGATNAATARTNLDLGWSALTNTDATNFRSAIGLPLAALTNTTAANFRTAIELGTAATNPQTAFQPSSTVLSNLASSNGINLTNIPFTNTTGTLPLTRGGTGGTNAAEARTNIGLGWGALTNTNGSGFQDSLFGSGKRALTQDTSDDGILTDDSISIYEDASPAFNFSRYYGDRIKFVAQPGSSTNTVVAWEYGDNLTMHVPIAFNNITNASTSRTNLGIPLPALTNTNTANFQGAIFPIITTNAPTNTNAPTPDAWLDIRVGTNTYKLPLWQ
jgi:hypothetical protein